MKRLRAALIYGQQHTPSNNVLDRSRASEVLSINRGCVPDPVNTALGGRMAAAVATLKSRICASSVPAAQTTPAPRRFVRWLANKP